MDSIIEQIAKERVNEYLEKEFEEIKSFAYKKLWETREEGKECTLELPYNKKIIILNDKISFDNKKTFIHRSEEKLIIKAFEELQRYSVKCLYEEICKDIKKDLDRVEKGSVGKGSDKYKSIDNTSDDFIKLLKQLSEDEKEDLSKCFTLVLELQVIDEQIELLKSMDGNKEKLLCLLEEKHRILKSLKNI